MSSAADDPRRTPIELRDLGAGDAPVRLVQWLVEVGAEVTEGERVAEILADGVLFHVAAPASGKLTEIHTCGGGLIDKSGRLGSIDATPQD